VGTDASEGIDRSSIIKTRGKALAQAVRRIHDRMAQPALIEQYIEGRELNVSVISRKGELEVLPLAEIDFRPSKRGPRIVGYEAKWLADSFEFHHTPRIIPAPLPKRWPKRSGFGCRRLSRASLFRVLPGRFPPG
jgi:D-alanine-D-alanine ligase